VLATAIVVCALAQVPLLYAEHVDSLRLRAVVKPIASLAFVVVGATTHAPPAVIVGLVLAMLGDVLLIPGGAGLSFLLGLGSFLAGHVAYATSFLIRGVAPLLTIGVLAALAIVAVPVARWLLPHVRDPKMRAPVIAYMIVITAMVALAAGTRAPWILVGAVAFYLSDLSVARDRFVASGFANRLWGLPLYYAAQIVIAISTAG
jgi:uncharacterized membrane protein YhhN